MNFEMCLPLNRKRKWLEEETAAEQQVNLEQQLPLQQHRLWAIPVVRALLLGTMDCHCPLSLLRTEDNGNLLNIILSLLTPHWELQVPHVSTLH